MNLHETSAHITPAEHALALAETLEIRDEITLGPTDQELCALALKEYAAQLIAGLAA